MGKYQQATDALQRMALQYQDIAAVAEALADLDGLDNARAELSAQLDELRLRRSSMADEVVEVGEKLEAARAEARQIVDQANVQASAIRSLAQSQADQAVIDARVKADGIVSAAHAEADAARADADRALNAAITGADQANRQRYEAEKARDAAVQELADLNKKLEDARQRIANLLQA